MVGAQGSTVNGVELEWDVERHGTVGSVSWAVVRCLGLSGPQDGCCSTSLPGDDGWARGKMGLVVVRDGERDRKMLRSGSRAIGEQRKFQSSASVDFLVIWHGTQEAGRGAPVVPILPHRTPCHSATLPSKPQQKPQQKPSTAQQGPAPHVPHVPHVPGPNLRQGHPYCAASRGPLLGPAQPGPTGLSQRRMKVPPRFLASLAGASDGGAQPMGCPAQPGADPQLPITTGQPQPG